MASAPISVIIPCYRCADVLGRAIRSVVEQELLPKEIILVEDCSSDGGATRAVVEHLARLHADTVVVRTLFLDSNVGPGSARNAGWEMASQALVAFLDADDAWHPSKLRVQYGWMVAHPDCDASSHLTGMQVPGATMPQVGSEVRTSPIDLWPMLLSNLAPTRTVMVRRTLPLRFAKGARFSEDYALWLEVVASGRRFERIDACLAFSFRPEFSAGGQSARLWRMEAAELATYARLARSGQIAWAGAAAAIGFSLLKFVRRMIIRHLVG